MFKCWQCKKVEKKFETMEIYSHICMDCVNKLRENKAEKEEISFKFIGEIKFISQDFAYEISELENEIAELIKRKKKKLKKR